MDESLERFLNFRVHPAVWLLLALAVLYFTLAIVVGGFAFVSWLGAFAGAGAFVFAAAVVLVAADRRLLVAGAVSLCVPPALLFARRLATQVVPQLAAADLLEVPSAVGWLFTMGGALAIGLAVGGVRSRLGWAAVALGIGAAFTLVLWQLSNLLAVYADWPPALQPPLNWSLSLLGSLVWIGWGYLLGAGFSAGLRWLVVGVTAIFLGVVLDFAAVPLVTADTQPLFDQFALPAFQLLSIASWAALVASAFVELKSPGWSYPTASSEPA
jgi:hypothetical protein